MQKKKFILYILIIFFFILLIVLSSLSIKALERNFSSCCKSYYNLDTSSPFSINKIVYFSSSNCKSDINSNSSFSISNLYQYTDIAIFINNNNNDGVYNAKNTLKNVSLSDIKFHLPPTIGTPSLYYKNINNFAQSNFDESKKIENTINFDCTSEDNIDFSEPILYNNAANPITLCYVNSNLINSYTLGDTISNISYNGSLLKMCNITLNSISSKLSFLVTIKNNQDEIYTCPIILTIPLSTENSTIYDGSLVLTDNTKYNFIKSK